MQATEQSAQGANCTKRYIDTCVDRNIGSNQIGSWALKHRAPQACAMHSCAVEITRIAFNPREFLNNARRKPRSL